MRFLILILVLFISGCSTAQPTDLIIQNTKKELTNIKETVTLLEKQTQDNCKTEAFIANVQSIKGQLSSINDQIDVIKNTCSLEKQKLKMKITNREMIILFLIIFIIVYLYFKVKGSIK